MNLLPKQISRAGKKRSGWTLMEMMVAVGLGSLILASVGSVYVFTRRTMDATGNYEELDRQSRAALDQMTRDIRQCGALTNQNSTTMWLTAPTNTGGLPYPIMYNWNSNLSQLQYSFNNTTNVLLKGCSFLRFSYFSRNPSNQTTVLFWPSSNATSTKVIVIDWVCKKTNYTTLTDSESVQTAKVVLRN
jgi:type II secretory pathway pseudopilin PulG